MSSMSTTSSSRQTKEEKGSGGKGGLSFEKTLTKSRLPKDVSVAIVVTPEDASRAWERAIDLQKVLEERGYAPVRVYNKLGFDMDELLFVAQHRVVGTPCCLLLSKETPIVRMHYLPTLRVIEALILRLFP